MRLARVLAELSRTGQATVRCTPSSLSGCRGDSVHVPSCPYGAEVRRVAAEQEHPRLWVWRAMDPGRWLWCVVDPDAETIERGHAPSWAEALAVGLAALEAVTVRST